MEAQNRNIGGHLLKNRVSFGKIDNNIIITLYYINNNNELIILTYGHIKIIAERNVFVKLKKKIGLTINNIIVNVSLER